MMELPKFSVIMAVRNCEQYVGDALSSIIDQLYKDFEVIIIDDGSDDETKNIVEKFCNKDKRLKLFCQKRSGVSVARNFGLKMAKGEYVTFLDGDDKYGNDFLKEVSNILESDEWDVVITNFYLWEGQEIKYKATPTCTNQIREVSAKEFLKNIFSLKSKKDELKMAQGGYVWNKIYRRKTILGIEFRENIRDAEDEFFNAELAIEKKPRIAYISTPLIYYRLHQSSAVHRKNFSFRHLDTRRDIFERYKRTEFMQLFAAAHIQKVVSCIIAMARNKEYINEQNVEKIKENCKIVYEYISIKDVRAMAGRFVLKRCAVYIFSHLPDRYNKILKVGLQVVPEKLLDIIIK